MLGLTPATIFKLTLCASVIVLAAGIIYHTNMDIDVYGCLVYGVDSDCSSVGYDTSAGALWEKYIEFKD